MLQPAPRQGRASIGHILIYSAAHFGKSLLWNTSSLIFAFFLTEAVGLSPQRMGQVLALSLLVNAMTDMLAGRLLARRVAAARAAAGAQLAGAAWAGAAFVAFAFSGLVPEGIQPAYVLGTLLLFRIGYSLYDVPQNAYMAFASAHDGDRAVMAAARYVSAGGSILLIAVLFAPVVQAAAQNQLQTQAQRFVEIALILAALSGACSAGLYIYSRRTHATPARAPDTNVAAPQAADAHGFWLLLAGIFLLSSASPWFSKLEAYFAAYALEAGWAAALFMACAPIGKVAAQPAWAWLAARTSLDRTLGVAAAAMALSALFFYPASRAGEAGALVAALFYGAAWGGAAMALWGLVARVAAAQPQMATRRYGLFTFFSKTAQAGAVFFIGQALPLVDYRDPVAGPEAIALIMTLGPAAGGLLLLALSAGLRGRDETPPGGLGIFQRLTGKYAFRDLGRPSLRRKIG